MDEFSIFLVVFFAAHLCLYFFDFIFKTCSFFPYLYFLTNTGLEIQPFRVTWFTSAFNRLIQKWGTVRPRLQLAWFSAGVWVTICLMPIAVFLVLHTIFVTIKQYVMEETTTSTLMVEPVVPGWNLPTSDYVYYIVSLLICSILHELGHAMAAVREDAHLIGMSLTVFFVVPVAITHLDRLEPLQPMKQLRILCAGVWNNVFVALLAAVVATTLPWALYPFFDFGVGVQVKSIKEGSSLSGAAGLILGDKITQLNNCPVFDAYTWQDCIVKITQEANVGFCIPDIFIKEHDESVPAKHVSSGAVECCEGGSASHVCFEYQEAEGEPLLLPQHSCLNARRVVDISAMFCQQASDCPQALHCFRPSLENATRLVRVQRAGSNVVLYLGHPTAIYHSVQVSEFINLYRFFPSIIPEAFLKLLTFVTYFSFGLAILNVIPCFCFDGQNIVCKLVDVLLEKKVPPASARQAISLCITVLGTCLVCLYVIVVFTLQ